MKKQNHMVKVIEKQKYLKNLEQLELTDRIRTMRGGHAKVNLRLFSGKDESQGNDADLTLK